MQEDILVVDDEPQMLIALQETLKRKSFRVTTAGSGSEALRRLGEHHYDLIITDMRMPNVSGLDLLRRVKSTAPQTPVVLLTAYGTIQNAVEAMRQGAFDYLLKPFSSDSLESVVRRALGASQKEELGHPHEIVTRDPGFLAILERAGHVASSSATVLIEAESGTGKELLARMIHRRSPRLAGPFVAVNCAALPENLLESELFGFEKGAFTGASASKPGKFEMAHQGTLLLDEIGEMAPILQAKLLRVLQEREVDRIGGREPVKIDVRIIATTNRDLAMLVQSDRFREDLYYRLNVVRLCIPPLRERKGDIPLLVDFFCRRYAKEFGRPDICFSREALDRLAGHLWPGNVRELENAVQRAVAICVGREITSADLLISESPAVAEQAVSSGITVKEMERQLIWKTLQETGGNRTQAARILGISLRTLRNKLNDSSMKTRQEKVAQTRAYI